MIQAVVDASIYRSEYFKNDGNRLVITMIYEFSNFHCVLPPVFDGHVLLKLSDHPPAFFHNAHNFYRGADDFPHLLLGISHMYIINS
jgi:hypothetical protein